MSRQGPRKKVDAHHWRGRLQQARDFHRSARDAAELAESGANGNPIMSQVVLSAIGYGDALTARFAQVVNQQDHAIAARLLREVLREKLPDAQERRFKRLLAHKDQIQYGAKESSLEDARRLLDELDAFAIWVEDLLT